MDLQSVHSIVFIVVLGSVNGVYVETYSGWIRGVVRERAIAFLGIPFAEPPQRWQNPRPPRPWSGVWNADRVRPMCLQPACVTGQRIGLCLSQMSEDCLYLNVHLPLDSAPGGNKSVMVFIHGGNFLSYTGGAALLNGDILADRGDVIVVTFNYRLGALGFLVTGSGPNAAIGNYGIRDQRLALQWINRNIYRFGGDPRKVTIYGQSAGAISTAIHMISRKADRLFQQAILQSLPFSIPLKSFNEAYQQGLRFASSLNCSPDDINCLRRRTPQEILQAQASARSPSSTFLQRFMPWTPHYDGDEVPMDIQTAYQRDLYTKKPIIIGTNAEEGASYVYEHFDSPLNVISYSALLLMINPLKGFNWLSRYYPKNKQDSRERLSELTTDFLFTCPTRKIAKLVTRNEVPVWMYVFDHSLSFLNHTQMMEYCHTRACHGSELPYIFQTFKGSGFNLTNEELQMSDKMLIHWTNFAKFGNPNGAFLSSTFDIWPRYSKNETLPFASMRFQVPSSELVKEYRSKECDKFDQQNFRAR